MSRFCERTRNGVPIDSGADLVVGIAIAWIEAPAVTDHHLELRMLRRQCGDALAIVEIERQRLFAEYVLARLQGERDLLGMQRRRSHQEHGLDAGIREQRRVVPVDALDAETVACPGQFVGDRAACRNEFGPRHALRQVLGVPATQSAEAGDADTQTGAAHNSMTRFSRHEWVAASASSSAFTPSWIVVLTGVPSLIAAKKCAISLAYATR